MDVFKLVNILCLIVNCKVYINISISLSLSLNECLVHFLTSEQANFAPYFKMKLPTEKTVFILGRTLNFSLSHLSCKATN